jgi:hypothetical protein
MSTTATPNPSISSRRSAGPTRGANVCRRDDYHTHMHQEINDWLAKHPRITLHLTPTSRPWLNLAKVFFRIINRQAIRRGTSTSVAALVAIGSFFSRQRVIASSGRRC